MTAAEVKDVPAVSGEAPAVAAAEVKRLVLADAKGHVMKHIEGVGEGWICQKCKKACPNGGYTCLKCPEDDGVKLCDECAENMSKNMRCGKPEKHVLDGYMHDDLCKVHPEYLEGYACDECCEFGPFEALFHCEKCEYDLCPECAGALMVCNALHHSFVLQSLLFMCFCFPLQQFGVKRAETDRLPGSSLEAMLKMMSAEDIEKCCKGLPEDEKDPSAPKSGGASQKSKKKPKNKKKKGRR